MPGSGGALTPGRVVLVVRPDRCVRAAARDAHRHLVQRALQGGGLGPVERAREELLRRFLETADFRQIRAEHARLLEGRQELRVVLEARGRRAVCRPAAFSRLPGEAPA